MMKMNSETASSLSRASLRFVAMLLALLCGGASAWAESPSVRIKSLYEDKSLAPGFLLPFRIESDLPAGVKIDTIQAIGEADSGCRAMKDPYLPTYFLLKCQNDSSVLLQLRLVSGTRGYDVSYGPLKIQNPAPGMEGTDPVAPPSSPDQRLAGRQLYNSYCVSCHSSPREKSERTAQQIKAAFALPKMQFLADKLTDEDLERLAIYLRNP